MFRDTPNSGGGGVPRSASSYSVQAPDMEDVKESVRQVWDNILNSKSATLDCLNLPLLCKTNLCHRQGVSKLGGRLSGMASGVMSSIQVGFEIQMVFGEWSVWSLWKQNPCQSYIVLSESETGQLVVWFRYLAVEWCFCILFSTLPLIFWKSHSYLHWWFIWGQSWWKLSEF